MNRLFISIVLTANIGIANAAIEQRDLVVGSNDKYLTYDSRTNLEWLDLSYTQGRSFNQISNNWGGLIDKGFRYATLSDLAELTSSFGLSINQSYTNVNYASSDKVIFSVASTDSLMTLIHDLGVTLTSSNEGVIQQEWSYGLFAYNTPDEYGRLPYLSVGYQNAASMINSSIAVGQTASSSLSSGYGEMGSFLVRNVPISNIPEPSQASLLVLGLIAICSRKYSFATKNR